eukprot:2781810-Prymnesium_polylepis.1
MRQQIAEKAVEHLVVHERQTLRRRHDLVLGEVVAGEQEAEELAHRLQRPAVGLRALLALAAARRIACIVRIVA